jgi:hypothetical protein
MKLTKALIKRFEEEQKNYGTEVALSNIIFEIASDLLKDTGVIKIKVSR